MLKSKEKATTEDEGKCGLGDVFRHSVSVRGVKARHACVCCVFSSPGILTQAVLDFHGCHLPQATLMWF